MPVIVKFLLRKFQVPDDLVREALNRGVSLAELLIALIACGPAVVEYLRKLISLLEDLRPNMRGSISDCPHLDAVVHATAAAHLAALVAQAHHMHPDCCEE